MFCHCSEASGTVELTVSPGLGGRADGFFMLASLRLMFGNGFLVFRNPSCAYAAYYQIISLPAKSIVAVIGLQ